MENIRIGDSETIQSFFHNPTGVVRYRYDYNSLHENFDGLLPTFIKKRETAASENSNNNNTNVPMALTTSYPSLSSRLNAAIHFNKIVNTNDNSPRRNNNNSIKSNDQSGKRIKSATNNTSVMINTGGKSTNNTKNTEINTFKDKSDFKSNNFGSANLFSETSIFSSNDIDEILNYLLSANNGVGDQLLNLPNKYVHVTSKYNIESVVRKNFYDLMIIDVPCDSEEISRKIITVRDNGIKKELSRNQIMQLSLYGLLIHNINEFEQLDNNFDEFIPLKEFMKEREQLLFLRTGRFFGNLINYLLINI